MDPNACWLYEFIGKLSIHLSQNFLSWKRFKLIVLIFSENRTWSWNDFTTIRRIKWKKHCYNYNKTHRVLVLNLSFYYASRVISIKLRGRFCSINIIMRAHAVEFNTLKILSQPFVLGIISFSILFISWWGRQQILLQFVLISLVRRRVQVEKMCPENEAQRGLQIELLFHSIHMFMSHRLFTFCFLIMMMMRFICFMSLIANSNNCSFKCFQLASISFLWWHQHVLFFHCLPFVIQVSSFHFIVDVIVKKALKLLSEITLHEMTTMRVDCAVDVNPSHLMLMWHFLLCKDLHPKWLNRKCSHFDSLADVVAETTFKILVQF